MILAVLHILPSSTLHGQRVVREPTMNTVHSLRISLALVATGLLATPSAVSTAYRDDCEPLSKAKDMPALSVLLDSAGLYQRLAQVDAPALNNITISVLLSDSPSTYVAGVDTPTAIQDSVRVFVRESLRAQTKKTPQAFRVLVTGGKAIDIVAEPSMLCAPTLLNAGREKVPFVVAGAGRNGGEGAIPLSRDAFVPTIRVGVDGTVQDVTMKDGDPSSNLARNMKLEYSSRRYTPALLDGRPIEVLVRGRTVELVK